MNSCRILPETQFLGFVNAILGLTGIPGKGASAPIIPRFQALMEELRRLTAWRPQSTGPRLNYGNHDPSARPGPSSRRVGTRVAPGSNPP
jgi:hypothetical protein